jgi:hypothetical protein
MRSISGHPARLLSPQWLGERLCRSQPSWGACGEAEVANATMHLESVRTMWPSLYDPTQR